MRRRPTQLRGGWPLLATALGVLLAVGTIFVTSTPGEHWITAVADITQMVLSAVASISACTAARRSTERVRRAWTWIAVGTGSWSVGQLIWSYYELEAGHDSPFPSWADGGFLVFPVATAIGLWYFPTHQNSEIRVRNLLDGWVVVGSLLSISWSLVLQKVISSHSNHTPFQIAVALAYPVGDVLVISMVIYSVTRLGRYRRTQLMLALAMVAMAFSDSGFVYQQAAGSYHTGSLLDLGWVVAFVLVAVTAIGYVPLPSPPTPARLTPRATDRSPDAPVMLPYLPLVLAAIVNGVEYVAGRPPDLVEMAAIASAVAAVLARQYITLVDNRHLLDMIAAREEQLRQQAMSDRLTGLANRALFTDRVAHALDLHRRDMRPLALLFCDLDDFKSVNDTFGHPAGDELLIRVSDRLRGALRTGDTLARFGGDEFAILIEDGGESSSVGARIMDSLRAPFTIHGRLFSIQASVGMIELGPDEPSPSVESLLAHADIAMYSAKRSGKGRLALYEPTMMPAEILDLPLQMPLTEALAAGEISAVYQPVVSLADGTVVGLEALARWVHNGVVIPPSQFIPLALRSGLISALTDVMLEKACADLAQWSRQLGHERLQVAVNVPPSLITDRSFPRTVESMLARFELAPGQLVLEITEDALTGDAEMARTVTEDLNRQRVPLSLDDFGSGHSSLLHLQQIPLGTLKVDIGFVHDIDTNDRARRLLKALLGLGRELGLNVIAEGVERATQCEVLRILGCPMAQGHYFAPPVPASEVLALLADHGQSEQRPTAPARRAATLS